MKLFVQSYSGRKGDERPVRFRLEDNDYLVDEILDQWYGPGHVYYKVCANDGNLYILQQETSVPDGSWELISYRKTA